VLRHRAAECVNANGSRSRPSSLKKKGGWEPSAPARCPLPLPPRPATRLPYRVPAATSTARPARPARPHWGVRARPPRRRLPHGWPKTRCGDRECAVTTAVAPPPPLLSGGAAAVTRLCLSTRQPAPRPSRRTSQWRAAGVAAPNPDCAAAGAARHGAAHGAVRRPRLESRAVRQVARGLPLPPLPPLPLGARTSLGAAAGAPLRSWQTDHRLTNCLSALRDAARRAAPSVGRCVCSPTAQPIPLAAWFHPAVIPLFGGRHGRGARHAIGAHRRICQAPRSVRYNFLALGDDGILFYRGDQRTLQGDCILFWNAATLLE